MRRKQQQRPGSVTLEPEFPKEEKIDEAFSAAVKYFSENPNMTKYSPRKDKNSSESTIKNSFIKTKEGEIYMLARSSYLGKGGFANVKKAMGQDHKIFAARIERIKPSNMPGQSTEISLGKEAGLVKDTMTRKTQSKKPTGNTQIINVEKHREKYTHKQYEIQKIGGVSLKNFIKEQKLKLTSDERFRIATRIATEITKLHQKDIAHLDIKPDNIMIDPNTHAITIIDFGLSEKEISEKPQNRKGTPYYLPNEPTSRTKENLDIIALTRTLFFPKLKPEEGIAYSGGTFTYLDSALPSVLNETDIAENGKTAKEFFYSFKELGEGAKLLEEKFQSCDDLVIKMIETKHDIKIKFDPHISPEEKLQLLEKYDQLISESIEKKLTLSKEKINDLNDIPHASVGVNIEKIDKVIEEINHFKKKESEILSSVLFGTSIKQSKNYETMLKILNATDKNELGKCVVVYALLSSNKNSDLQNAVFKKMGFDTLQNARDNVKNSIVMLIQKESGTGATETAVKELDNIVSEIIKQADKPFELNKLKNVVSDLDQFTAQIHAGGKLVGSPQTTH